jgi:predicted small lipoprotein YifL
VNDKPAAIVCARRGLLAALTLLLLAACGRRGRPEPPPAADPAYPRAYPTK